MSLPGGFCPGDRVIVNGCTATVQGRAARSRCAKFSVAVQYDDGRLVDERVSCLQPTGKPSPSKHQPVSLLAAGNGILGKPAAYDVSEHSPETKQSDVHCGGPFEVGSVVAKPVLGSRERGLVVGSGPSEHQYPEARGRSGADVGYGIGHRILEDRYAAKPIGGGVEHGYGIGNRMLEDRREGQPFGGGGLAHGYGLGNRILEDRHVSQPVGGGVENGYGIGNRILEDRHGAQPVGGGVENGYGIGNRILENRHGAQPVGGGVENGYGIGNRILEDRHGAQPVGGGTANGYCVGNRILEDRHAAQPLGGGVEHGYGIGNRILEDRHGAQPLGGGIANGYRVGNRILQDPHASPPVGGGIGHGYGPGNRILEDRRSAQAGGAVTKHAHDAGNRHHRYGSQPSGAGPQLGYPAGTNASGGMPDKTVNPSYGLGNRILDDRHAEKPLGGEMEAGYGIGNRHVEDENVYTMGRDQQGAEPASSSAHKFANDDAYLEILNQNHRAPEVDAAIVAFRRGVEQRHGSFRNAFRCFDVNRKGFLGHNEFAAAFAAHGLNLSPDHLEIARLRFDRSRSGRIAFSDFCAVMS